MQVDSQNRERQIRDQFEQNEAIRVQAVKAEEAKKAAERATLEQRVSVLNQANPSDFTSGDLVDLLKWLNFPFDETTFKGVDFNGKTMQQQVGTTVADTFVSFGIGAQHLFCFTSILKAMQEKHDLHGLPFDLVLRDVMFDSSRRGCSG
jgi:hypothetical protein